MRLSDWSNQFIWTSNLKLNLVKNKLMLQIRPVNWNSNNKWVWKRILGRLACKDIYTEGDSGHWKKKKSFFFYLEILDLKRKTA